MDGVYTMIAYENDTFLLLRVQPIGVANNAQMALAYVEEDVEIFKTFCDKF